MQFLRKTIQYLFLRFGLTDNVNYIFFLCQLSHWLNDQKLKLSLRHLTIVDALQQP